MSAIIVGAGSYGEVYAAYLANAGIDVVGFLDDTPEKQGKKIVGVPVIGKTAEIETLRGVDVYAPIGNNRARIAFLERARSVGLNTPNYIHPSVILSPHVHLGQGVYVLLGSMVMPHVNIADDVMISMNVKIAHHTALERGVFLSTGTSVGARVNVGECAYLGMSTTAVTDKCRVIGADAFTGAGAVLVKDVATGARVAGVPARPI